MRVQDAGWLVLYVLGLVLSRKRESLMVLHYFLRSWLQNAAREKIREKVVEVANQQKNEATDDTHPFTQLPCQVGLVFASRVEAGGFEDLLEGGVTVRGQGFVARQGVLKSAADSSKQKSSGGRNVVIVRPDEDQETPIRAVEALIAGHQPPWIISAGFAVGLVPELKRHDVLMVDDLVDTAGNRLSVDLRVDPEALAQTPGVCVGRLVSTDPLLRTPEEKRSFGKTHDASAVDQETFALAETCRAHRVKFLAVRVILETVDEALPPDVQQLIDQQTHASRLGAAIGAVWRRPGSVKDLYSVKENALLASDRLGRFLGSMIEQLVPPGE